MRSEPIAISPTDEASNLALSELALDAAIEIETFQNNGAKSFDHLKRLGTFLDRYDLGDLDLVPVYDRALAGNGDKLSSADELREKLHAISGKIGILGHGEHIDVQILKDFCLSLHDVLLNYRIENTRRSTPSQMAYL